ncbi:NAD(P)-dependent alcohol dehydrogenase [Streptomyces sp. NPDC059740]|uniref:zinc-dependent alcohol dehydrogenase family protein n=1 Tax=Streptomyces sp. NPDC059740 TaxID=3346926 RepID=UPI003653EFA1
MTQRPTPTAPLPGSVPDRAAHYHLPVFQGIDSLRRDDRAVTPPGPRQVLVRMRAWSLNHRDLLVASDTYGRALVPDLTPLSDGAGEVVLTGPEVTRWTPGDRVVSVFMPHWQAGPANATRTAGALGGPAQGVLARYVLFEEDAVVRAPSHLSHAEAATLPCAGVTAWHALVAAGGLSAGRSVLTLGSGGVSVFALQFAAVSGARVLATSGSDTKLERLRALGAAEGVNHARTPDWGPLVARLSGGGVDHVVEIGGGGTLPQSLAAVRAGGRISLVGFLAGGGGADLGQAIRKGVTLQGMFVGSRQMFQEMNRALELHRLHPVVDSVFPFEEAPAAYRHLASGNHFGKVVIVDE